MKINFNPDYLMMDASDATYNAAIKVFLDAKILMCYFHLQQNVLKNCKSMLKTPEELAILQDALYDLHISKSEAEYDERLKKFKIKYNCKNTQKVYD